MKNGVRSARLMFLLLVMAFARYADARQLGCGVCGHEDGSLDITFGNHGKVISQAINDAVGLALLPSGTIVATGVHFSPETGLDFGLAAFTSYGAPQLDFGNDGVVYTDFATVLDQEGITIPSADIPLAITTQKGCESCATSCAKKCGGSCVVGDKLVVVGRSTATINSQFHFAVARYNSDGSLDTSFGTNGVVVTPIGIQSQANAVAIQADNKIVVVGLTRLADSSVRFAIVRYNCDGTLDSTFGCDQSNPGVVLVGFSTDIVPANDVARAVKIQKNGKIVVGGLTVDAFGRENFALVRLTPDGKLDKSFGPDHSGKVITDTPERSDRINALVLLENCTSCCTMRADGTRIVAVGTSVPGSTTGTTDFMLAGYKDNGSLDTLFGSNGTGIVLTSFSPTSEDRADAAVLHQDPCTKECTITAAGSTKENVGAQENIAVARYTLDGRLDERFGDDGKIITSVSGANSRASSLVVQCDGEIIAGGIVSPFEAAGSALLVRYNICQLCCL